MNSKPLKPKKIISIKSHQILNSRSSSEFFKSFLHQKISIYRIEILEGLIYKSNEEFLASCLPNLLKNENHRSFLLFILLKTYVSNPDMIKEFILKYLKTSNFYNEFKNQLEVELDNGFVILKQNFYNNVNEYYEYFYYVELMAFYIFICNKVVINLKAFNLSLIIDFVNIKKITKILVFFIIFGNLNHYVYKTMRCLSNYFNLMYSSKENLKNLDLIKIFNLEEFFYYINLNRTKNNNYWVKTNIYVNLAIHIQTFIFLILKFYKINEFLHFPLFLNNYSIKYMRFIQMINDFPKINLLVNHFHRVREKIPFENNKFVLNSSNEIYVAPYSFLIKKETEDNMKIEIQNLENYTEIELQISIIDKTYQISYYPSFLNQYKIKSKSSEIEVKLFFPNSHSEHQLFIIGQPPSFLKTLCIQKSFANMKNIYLLDKFKEPFQNIQIHEKFAIMKNNNSKMFVFGDKEFKKRKIKEDSFGILKYVGIITSSDNLFVYTITKSDDFGAFGNNSENVIPTYRKSLSSTSLNYDNSLMKCFAISNKHFVFVDIFNGFFGSNRNNFNLFMPNPFKSELEKEINPNQNEMFFRIVLPLELSNILKVVALETGTILLSYNKLVKKNELYSFGLPSPNPMLGQGSSINQNKYCRLIYPQEVNFVEIQSRNTIVGAITDNGNLYLWGINPDKAKILLNAEESTPKFVIEVSHIFVTQLSIGKGHLLFIGFERNNPSKLFAYAMGNNKSGQLGCIKKNKSRLIKIDCFDSNIPYLISAGDFCSFIGLKPSQPSNSFNCCEEQIQYFTRLENGDIKQFKQSKELPTVCYVTKFLIKNFNPEIWPKIENLKLNKSNTELKCFKCKNNLIEVSYYNISKDEEYIICENCFNTPFYTFHNPEIYLRIKSIQETPAQIPKVKIDDIYKKISVEKNISIMCYPEYETCVPITSENTNLLNKYEKHVEKSKKYFPVILSRLNKYYNENGHSLIVGRIMQKDLKEIIEHVLNDKEFSEIKNIRLTDCIEFLLTLTYTVCNLNFDLASCSNALFLLDKIRNLLLNDYDIKYYQNLFYLLPCCDLEYYDNGPLVFLDRTKARQFYEKKIPDINYNQTIFGQLLIQTRKMLSIFHGKGWDQDKNVRILNKFEISFLNERGLDAGGPFREMIEIMSTELLSPSLILLKPSSNYLSHQGSNMDKFVINSQANSHLDQEAFQFLGVFLAFCLKSNHTLNIDLPDLLWKQMLGCPLVLEDLKEIDQSTVNLIEELKAISNSTTINSFNFNDYYNLTFSFPANDRTIVPLEEGGELRIVSYEDIPEFIEKLEKFKLFENQFQVDLIKKGFNLIIPLKKLANMSPHELSTKIFGEPEIDIETLKKRTLMELKEPELISNFWRALNEFNQEERRKFLKFLSGSSRLKATKTEEYTVSSLKLGSNNPDSILPEGHTCNSEINIPLYSSFEIMKKNIKFAIENCMEFAIDWVNENDFIQTFEET